MKDSQQKNRQAPNFVFGVVCALIVFFALQVGGFGTVNALAALAGGAWGLAPFAQFLLSVFVGLAYFVLLVVLVRAIMRFNGHRKQHMPGFDFGDAVMDAMSRISQGDFNVFIEPTLNGMHFEVAEGINQMAQKLGTMEHLRQDFISNVSHEIQSPLTSISGFAELLQSGTLTPEQEQHYIAIIIAESKRLSRLSDNLLKLSSLESQTAPIACKEYRLDKQLESTVLMLEPQWRKKRLVLEMDAVSANFCGDEELLSQVWVNLLYNAIKFTPEGGTISVLLSAGAGGKAADTHDSHGGAGVDGSHDSSDARGSHDGTWQIVIADTGIGIPAEDQMHIFERFYKVDKSRERAAGGNGLGLSLAKKIVELHNGQITVESTPNVGSTFTVTLQNSP